MRTYYLNDDINIEKKYSISDFQGIFDDAVNKVIIMGQDEIKLIYEIMKVPKHTIEDCWKEKLHVKFESYENFNYGVVADISMAAYDTLNFIADKLTFFHFKNCLLIVESGSKKNSSVVEFEKKLLHDKNGTRDLMRTVWGVLFVLLSTVTLLDDSIVTNIEKHSSDLEDSILTGAKIDVVKEIVEIRRKLQFLRRKFEPMIETAEDLVENENELIDQSGIRYFRLYKARIERLNNKLIIQRETVSELRETYQSQMDISLNNTMKIFTVITSLVLPLTFITGWFGMNFKNMKILDSTYGYVGVEIACVALVIVGLILFKRKGFI